VLINVMGGGDQVASLKQLESLRAVPNEARLGWWTMEWWWDQPNTPYVKEFAADMKSRTGRAATARNWFGYVSVQTLALIANQERTLDAVKLAHGLSDFKLPPQVALQPDAPDYRAGDHELMSAVFVGEAHPPKGDPDNMFTVHNLVPGAKAAGAVEDTGCKLQWPA
jgi:branched-chain amino acid transport system substrate-binding protein